MKHVLLAFSPVALAFFAPLSIAQASEPGPSITQATLQDSESEYQHSPLCTKEELTLWTCQTRKRVFSLCSSKVVNRTSGYLQYRASDGGKLVMQYPADKKPPTGLFTYTSFLNGNASIEFSNGGYRYSLFDPLRSASSISVSGPGASDKITQIACGPNQTLQLNYTMRLMYDSGVWADP
ncbi:hypothetical protein [Xanthomonas rydalmerensis]|uniref:Secreted protein n=1 Tax=Xanthomonas rydalmerensis TaxID=3046274 RepID=A0ABZ0JN63_9XANT|nr:hypothetical protein [Xanthomonas sp. DM-2023]WOS41258.1 hypothetical protein QN243_01880 [Xanthomonas sp. DM-2023]WOS45443.1 hypothetical protein QN242_01880 [Xanthomonas sp. DM-2023]WOS49622.1 hypothetical protein QN240_01880 [Xanthomonas sp. DM-2023]WOS53802.1 hypothetical protein QN244_01880 [Xanthomonas sp. DM-2023]WOS57985.1 hypothetical protein QN245_01880 [Xanthomonas sp. DM-2023]